MEERRQTRAALGDISNTTAQTDYESAKREERNRKQREYRARKRDDETMEQREERNRKQREYRARKRAEETHVPQTAPSTTCQPSAFDGKENWDENESTDWLHRNEEYIRRRQAPFIQMQPHTSNSVITNSGGSSSTPCHMSSLQSVLQHRPSLLPMQIESPNSVVINTAGASSTPKQLLIRNWYISMDASSKEKLLQHRRDYLVPGSKGPRHLQLYFYDTDQDDTLSHRVKRSPDLDINLIRHVLQILQAVNPYVQTFNRVGAIPNIDEYVIELNTNVTPDQRRYNLFTKQQHFAFLGNDPQKCFDRSVIIYPKGEADNSKTLVLSRHIMAVMILSISFIHAIQ